MPQRGQFHVIEPERRPPERPPVERGGCAGNELTENEAKLSQTLTSEASFPPSSPGGAKGGGAPLRWTVNEEVKRRTLVVRIFPNDASCLRLIRALTAEIHEEWHEGNRYINMELMREQRRADLRGAAA